MQRVVLLHSGLGDSRLWARQIEALQERFEVLAPDLPGWGKEPLPEEPVSYVDRVAELLPAVLVGNSMGGRIALETALAHPGAVERLVLIAPALSGWEYGEEMQEQFAAGEEARESGNLERVIELNLDFWLAPEHHDLVRPMPRRSLALQTARTEPELIRPATRPLSLLAVPTLIVYGELDKSDYHDIARLLHAQIPGARLAEVPGAGHLVGIERPEELNQLLLEFLGPDDERSYSMDKTGLAEFESTIESHSAIEK